MKLRWGQKEYHKTTSISNIINDIIMAWINDSVMMKANYGITMGTKRISIGKLNFEYN